MKHSLSSRFAAAAVIAAAALGAATAAQARPDVFFSIDFPGPPVYVQPQPVYVQPQPVYVQPRPIYVQPPAYEYERRWHPSYEADFERQRAWRRAEWQRREWERRHHHERGGHWSHDRDRD